MPAGGSTATLGSVQSKPDSSGSAAVTPSESAATGPRQDLPVLQPGDRVEVLWTIERDNDDGANDDDDANDDAAAAEDEQRWWGAKVAREGAGDSSYVVLYDAYAEFPASEVCVTLCGPRTLRDESAGGERMRWRREGDESEGGEWDLLGDDAGEISAWEMVQAQDETGEGDLVMEEFGKLPAAQQSSMAHCVRTFADEVKSEMRKLVEQRGPGTVVTEKDISDMVCTLRARHGI